ncbi:MAG: serine hydrolase domain-containing protein [Melioribacteraceae bacterium]|nr:serine hydrolase domain-containing protein [Melioribacteraceae bacterium]
MKILIILILVLNGFIIPNGFVHKVTEDMSYVLDSLSIVENFNGIILLAEPDSIIFFHSSGYADFEHNIHLNENSSFNIASLTKQFTAAAILLLEEHKQLSTNDTINEYLPDFKYSDQITIHQLLTHSSGLPNYNNFDDYSDYLKKSLSNIEVMEWIEQHELNFTSGTDYEYSNSGYFILNCIIEEVSGLTYREFLMNHIFKNANMTSTDNYSSFEIIPNRASRYLVDENRILKPDWFNHSLKTGSASIFSTSNDLFSWYANLTNNNVLNDSSLSKMFTNHFDGYGYGVGKGDSDTLFFEHEGKIPGMNAYSAFFFDPDYYLLVWSNISDDNFWDLRDELRDTIINLIESYK